MKLIYYNLLNIKMNSYFQKANTMQLNCNNFSIIMIYYDFHESFLSIKLLLLLLYANKIILIHNLKKIRRYLNTIKVM